jgi:hypothetical protein
MQRKPHDAPACSAYTGHKRKHSHEQLARRMHDTPHGAANNEQQANNTSTAGVQRTQQPLQHRTADCVCSLHA